MRDTIRRALEQLLTPRECIGCFRRRATRLTPCGDVCGPCYRDMFHPDGSDDDGEAPPPADELNTDPWTWDDGAVTADV